MPASRSEWDDVDAVVNYLMTLLGVEKVSLIGWSAGGRRTGGYAALHPEKVDKLVLLAPVYNRQTPTEPPAELPAPGFPLTVSSYLDVGQVSPAEQACGNAVELGAAEAVRAANRQIDPVGAGWGAGTTRASLAAIRGWNATMAGRVQAPALLMSGELDTTVPPQNVRDLFQDLGAEQKVFLELACTSHGAQSQSHYKIVQDASIDWLLNGSLDGQTSGSLRKGD